MRVHDDAAALAADPSIDLVVEASGSPDAAPWLRTALARGAGAVSANKLAIASDVPLLEALAARHPLFHCEAAVAAALPIVRALRDSLDGEEIYALRGVLNGTTTYVLSRIEQGEASPKRSRPRATRGTPRSTPPPTCAASTPRPSWRSSPPSPGAAPSRATTSPRAASAVRSSMPCASPAPTAPRVRLVAEAWEDDGLHLRVEPRILPEGDVLARVEGVVNVVEVRSALAGPLVWYGAGAGGDRTASALVGDLLAAARALTTQTTGRIAA